VGRGRAAALCTRAAGEGTLVAVCYFRSHIILDEENEQLLLHKMKDFPCLIFFRIWS